MQTRPIVERVAWWLLTSQQGEPSATIVLTHDQLSRMMGFRRESITGAAAELQRQGLISYSRGSIAILNLPGLLTLTASSTGP
jgi:CRP-like cAMP-binding protein